jgi:hypothetical protein
MRKEDEKYNPFNDRSLHTSQKEEMILAEDREGFNDALKHYDGVNGFQAIKSLTGLPKPHRSILRIYAFIAVGGFFVVILFTLFKYFGVL